MVASEATPFAKTGGLADVVGSLPDALADLGHQVAVVLPRYGGIDLKPARRTYENLDVWFGPDRYRSTLFLIDGKVPFYFVDCPPLYEEKRTGYYGDADGDYPDNHIRFAVLSRAALSICRYIFRPDILHCHDWQAGLVPTYLRSTFVNDPTFLGIRTLFTIHNIGYQGLFPEDALAQIGLDDSVFHPGGIEYWGKISLLKGGLVSSDALNTVSPTYAREIQTPEYGLGMDGILRARSAVLSGIVNGVDYAEWNPETDPSIAANYSRDDPGGKQFCKRDLIAEFGLPPETSETPLLGIVSRFTSQKGADLIAEIAERLTREDLQLVALGTGDAEYEELFRKLASDYPSRVSVRIGFDNRLAHKIEAGADMFLMPSRYEPCGLNQMYSLKYGTVPIVRATGGLDDTIKEDTGFKFSEYSGEALLDTIQAACNAWKDPTEWRKRMRRGMQEDYSWRASAVQYSFLYERLARTAPMNLLPLRKI
jgi:starch synthase